MNSTRQPSFLKNNSQSWANLERCRPNQNLLQRRYTEGRELRGAGLDSTQNLGVYQLDVTEPKFYVSDPYNRLQSPELDSQTPYIVHGLSLAP